MKVGVIGCGKIAQRAHLPAYRSLGLEIVAVTDTNLKRAAYCSKKFGARKYFVDYHDLLALDLDLVSICTPNELHVPIAIEAARAGKHILLEKPMATSLNEADQLLQACKDHKVKICIVHNYRFLPGIVEGRKRVQSGRIGEILEIKVSMHFFTPMQWSDGPWYYSKWGVLDDLGVHAVDMLNYICGNPEPLYSRGVAVDHTGKMGCFNHVLAEVVFKGNLCGNIDVCWVSGALESSVYVLGSAGSLLVDLKSSVVWETHGYVTPFEELGNYFTKFLKAIGEQVYLVGPLMYIRPIIEGFVRSIELGGEPPVSGADGRANVALLDMIKQNIK